MYILNFHRLVDNCNHYFRYLIMAWGTNKFLKKLVKPNAISNNELADFISRVPDNEELVSTTK